MPSLEGELKLSYFVAVSHSETWLFLSSKLFLYNDLPILEADPCFSGFSSASKIVTSTAKWQLPFLG